MLTENEIRSEFQENYRYAYDFWSPFVTAAQVYTRAAAGSTWTRQELKELLKEGREPIEFNIMRRPLQFYSGYLRDNLNSVIYESVEGSDEKTADQLSKLSYYIWDKGKGYNIFLDAADEMLKSGISLCGIEMDYSKDSVNGDISFFKRCYNQFFLDPTFEHVDLRDCSYSITRDLVNKKIIKQMLPFVDPKRIDEIQNGFRDDKFLSYHPNFTTLSRNRNIMAYDQYYKRTNRERKFLTDIDSSFSRDITDLSNDEIAKLKRAIYRFRELRSELEEEDDVQKRDLPSRLEIRTDLKPYVELHIMLNGQEVYNGHDQTGIVETYPFAPLLCYMEPSIWDPALRIQGIGSTQWSNQRQFNKRHMKIIDMMDSDISTGFKYLIGSVPNPEDMQQSGQNKLIGVDPENAPQGLDSVQQLSGGGANPALLQYQQILDQMSLTLANITESVLGIDEKGNTQISGKLAQVRIAQGLRSNRKVFDNIELSQMILGKLVLNCVQNHYPPGKVKRIINEEPTEQFYSKEYDQYDCIVKQSIRSQSQKDAYYYELVNLKKEGLIDVQEEDLVDALHIAGISDLKESIAKRAQAREEVQQQQQQLLLQAQVAEIENVKSNTQANLGLSQERKSRVISNLSLKDERESEAQQNIAQAALDRAKTISEISKLNDDRIIQVARFVNELERQEAAGREAQKAQVEAQSHRINTDTLGSAENNMQNEAVQELETPI